MRCACQNCGEYMVQDEKGLFSRCICPHCFTTCNACLGTQQRPASPEELRFLLNSRQSYDARQSEMPEDTPDNRPEKPY